MSSTHPVNPPASGTLPDRHASPDVSDLQRRADVLAHDFNNLLTTITGYARLLANSFEEGDPRRTDAEEILQGAQRVSKIVGELTRLSRLPEGVAPEASGSDLGRETEGRGGHPDSGRAQPSGRSETVGAAILVVDDERSVRYLVRTLLTRAGYEVSEAATAEEADRSVAERAGAVDLVISDIALPESSGPELVRRLRERQPALKVLFMSGYSDEQIRRDGSIDPDVPFVQKPFTVETLTDAVRRVLGH